MTVFEMKMTLLPTRALRNVRVIFRESGTREFDVQGERVNYNQLLKSFGEQQVSRFLIRAEREGRNIQ